MEQTNQGSSLFQLNIDAGTSYVLKNAATWAKIVGILQIIFGALSVLGGLFYISQKSEYSEYGEAMTSQDATGFMVGACISAGILILSGIFALSFGNKINAALRT